MREARPEQVHVWDAFVRAFHWSLVAAFAVAFLTEDELLGLHVWAGYLVAALIVARVIWGFVGPRHARFADFICPPAAAAAYLRDLLAMRAPRHLGHSPAGGALLVALALTVASGLVAYGAGDKAGPLGFLFAEAAPAAPALVPAAHADEREDRREKAKSPLAEAAGEVHEFFANLTLTFVVLHVLGVALASFVHGENLTRAMITGWKRR
jgi:cytochrome b